MKSALCALSAQNLLPPGTLRMYMKEPTMVSVVSYVTSVVRALQLSKVWAITKVNTQGTTSSDVEPVIKVSTTSN